ncbi:efflux transporter outer membrane subunit [Rudanella paleaurantiibacter]|uniref:Efflux transporter outer membrane subunit n=1 Tax=Rudanella paleaurantiibacter TaxID=2614655 RepID=A0A7J5TTZ4_9BACT|nr:TolC family protein [Rudanella paleaurantiibacter]KAB7727346.1 efflux transporter outer membrane subunit [Rudanella paleaurantiibacter]
MFKRLISGGLSVAFLTLAITSCKTPMLVGRTENRTVPVRFGAGQDSVNTGKLIWREFFTDPYLAALIDTALHNNQELNITLQEIQIAQNDIRARTGEYLPFVGLRADAGVDKVGRYTRPGAVEENNEIRPGRRFPNPLPDFRLAANVSWEVDIWNKLHNAKRAAATRYLSSIEGKNFAVTNIVAEIANSYYELLGLDNQLDIVRKNIEIQTNALNIVRTQKESARVTELAVRRFEAQVLGTQSLQYNIQQRITETENRINFLVGRFPQPVQRSTQDFNLLVPQPVRAGLPSQLLQNRPDIRRAERELEAARLDVEVARANFLPSLDLSAAVGFNAYNPALLLSPESLLYSLVGGLSRPLVNRNAIKAMYASANARQIQAVFNYERAILNAYIEVANQLANMNNLQKSYDFKARQVDALLQSTNISNTLFKSARADYMEVLLTQRDALESRFDLVETRMQQLNAMVNAYRALGGGWN